MLNFPRLSFNRIFANNINLRFSLPLLECSSYLAIVEAYIQCQKRKTNLFNRFMFVSSHYQFFYWGEVGDFAILFHGGYPKRKALLLNVLSSLSTLSAAILAYYILEIVRSAIPYVMAFSAASFLYIALTDLYPQLHQKIGFRSAI